MHNNKHQIVMTVSANTRCIKNISNSVGTKTVRFCLTFLMMKTEIQTNIYTQYCKQVSRFCKVLHHICHSLTILSGAVSSQPNSFGHSCCSNFFPFNVYGATNPRESQIELIIESIPLRVIGFSLRVILNFKVSLSISQQIPKALSTGKLTSRSASFTPLLQ